MRQHPLTLLHGWGGDARVWGSLPALLAPAFAVTCPHLPGYGGTTDDGADFAASAARLAAELPPGALLGGWSLGALLALAIAARAPEKVGALVLFGATARFIADGDWPGQSPALLAQFRAALAAEANATRRRFMALMNQGDDKARALTRQLSTALSAPHPTAAALARGLEWLATVDLRPELPAIGCPVLLLHGAHDPLMPLAAAERLTETLAAARLETFPAAAHAPFLADPEHAAELIVAFTAAPESPA